MGLSNFIYTIGHGNRPLEELVEAVVSYDIDYLIDVRSTPYSRYCPQFSRESIAEAINATGRTKYAYLGDQLGGYPKEPEYQKDGKTDYDKYSKSERFQRGIARLKKGCCELGLRLCIMCSESDPTNCHRTRLISNELEKTGVPVRHIVFLPEGKRIGNVSVNEPDPEAYPEADFEADSEVTVNDIIETTIEDLTDKDPNQADSTEDFSSMKEDFSSMKKEERVHKPKVQTTLLTHAQVLSGAVRRIKTSGCIAADNYPDGGLFS